MKTCFRSQRLEEEEKKSSFPPFNEENKPIQLSGLYRSWF